jgi:hypothetical protein
VPFLELDLAQPVYASPTFMTRSLPSAWLAASVAVLCVLPLTAAPQQGTWQRTDTSVAWQTGSTVAWRFTFDSKYGKPFFDPLGPVGGPSLTNFKPQDHPWHYGLWFSWKYINGVNYWEEDRTSGKSQGATRWDAPEIVTEPDGRATMTMNLTYQPLSGHVDMTETRRIVVSAPDRDGGFTIDWRSTFVAGSEGAVLDRTPMPGEPHGAVNGGYAGLGARLAAAPLAMTVVTTEGPVTAFVNDRARPNAAAVACNFSEDGRDVGAIAIFSDPANIGARAPWYLINNATFRFADPAILAPAVKTLKAGETWTLHYRIALSRSAWTPESLRSEMNAWEAGR